LLDEARKQRDGGQVIAKPDTAEIGKRCDGIVDDVESVLAAAWIQGRHGLTVAAWGDE
jgi:hypothetical protein